MWDKKRMLPDQRPLARLFLRLGAPFWLGVKGKPKGKPKPISGQYPHCGDVAV